ncbi:MAG: OmpA family protein, partial [Treponema sp.]|nr:OmpA family protein [Treponema sp.]
MDIKRPIISLIFLIALIIPCMTQETWYEGFFVESSALYNFTPSIMKDTIKPVFGFRAALGYEYGNFKEESLLAKAGGGFRFALESGYTYMKGVNRLITEGSLVPLVFKFGYSQPLHPLVGLQADINLGMIFSNTSRYNSSSDIVNNNISKDTVINILGGLRGYVTITPLEYLKIYAGGGVDFIFEDFQPVPLAAIELGVSLKPFTLARKIKKHQEETSETGKIVFESRSENVVIEETRRGRTVRLLNAVYFEANTAVMLEDYRPILNEAGERLRANPRLRITLRGYTAPFGTAEGRAEVSAARARYCAEYLTREYGISASRMTIESFGAERAPAFRDASWESYRCVELLIQ